MKRAITVATYTGIPKFDEKFVDELRRDLTGRSRLPEVSIKIITSDEMARDVITNDSSLRALVIRLGDSEESKRRMQFVSKSRVKSIPTIVISKDWRRHKVLAQTCGAVFVEIRPNKDVLDSAEDIASMVAGNLQTYFDKISISK